MGGCYFTFKFLRYALDSWGPQPLKNSLAPMQLPPDTFRPYLIGLDLRAYSLQAGHQTIYLLGDVTRLFY